MRDEPSPVPAADPRPGAHGAGDDPAPATDRPDEERRASRQPGAGRADEATGDRPRPGPRPGKGSAAAGPETTILNPRPGARAEPPSPGRPPGTPGAEGPQAVVARGPEDGPQGRDGAPWPAAGPGAADQWAGRASDVRPPGPRPPGDGRNPPPHASAPHTPPAHAPGPHAPPPHAPTPRAPAPPPAAEPVGPADRHTPPAGPAYLGGRPHPTGRATPGGPAQADHPTRPAGPNPAQPDPAPRGRAAPQRFPPRGAQQRPLQQGPGRPGPRAPMPHGPSGPPPGHESPVLPPWQRGPGAPVRDAVPTTPLVRGADLPPLRRPGIAPDLSPDQAPTQLVSGIEVPRGPAQDPPTQLVAGIGVRAAFRAGAEPGVQAYPWLGDSPTELIPAISDDTELLARPAGAPAAPRKSSLGRSTSMIAIASLVSRITGFLRQILLVAVLSLGIVNSSYTVANTLPNIVYELLLGGVLSSVMIPLLVRAQRDDADGGEAYTRKLLTVAGVALLAATVVAMLAAGLLTRLYLGGSTTSTANPELATAFAWLLLPQIFFYGIGALFGAVLNSKGVFGPFAWAPVLNNVVVLLVLGVYVLVPGEISLDPVEMGNAKLLVLGLGTTLGIAVQALVLLPALRRLGVSFTPLWGWDPRLRSAGGLALWVVAYVLIGQAGYIVTTRVASAADGGAVAIYSNAWLLLQVPYGVLGVSLLTALMPRMSKAAAEGRIDDVVADLSLGSRLSTVFLVPISALLTVFGTEVGVALFSLGHGNRGGGAATLGATLAVSAFGLLPYAVTLLQLRVFYALTDSRTPTVIQLVIVGVKIPMLLVCPLLFEPQHVVLGLAAANSLSFVVGAVVGQWLLARRLGHVATREVLRTVGSTALASVVGTIVAYGVVLGLGRLVGGWGAGAGGAWAQLVLALVVAGPVMLAMLWVFRQRELEPVWRRLGRSRA